MKIPVYYMNDEQKEITVRIMDSTYDHTYTKSDNSETYHRLKSCEARVFELDVPEGSILYVKKWPGMVMLSYVDRTILASFDQQPSQPQDGASNTSGS